MATWGQSLFLQALGWAMLNSLWQMAALFALFRAAQQLFTTSPQRRYLMALATLTLGVCWFGYTLFSFYQSEGAILAQARFAAIRVSHSWNNVLSSVSIVYFLLLLVPAGRLFIGWRHIGHLKKFDLAKPAVEYRLFLQKVAQQLGIRRIVQVFISDLVRSPLTIGCFKPVILLPLAAVNQLSTQQVEAILLHELSHIRRYDYLINFIITLLQTLFYFNPFVKSFISQISFERELCCDQLVLQFEYDKMGYAAALLHLEKNMKQAENLALAAAGKKHLFQRIERIVGLEKKRGVDLFSLARAFASLLLVLVINSLAFVNHSETPASKGQTFAAIENPIFSLDVPSEKQSFSKAHMPERPSVVKSFKALNDVSSIQDQPLIIPDNMEWVAGDATDALVSPEEKLQITRTLEATKRVLIKSKWKEVAANIGDGMTNSEKQEAEKVYLKEVNKIDWNLLNRHLITRYATVDWPVILNKLSGSLAQLQVDSVLDNYHQILGQMKKIDLQKQPATEMPMPDISVQKIESIKSNVQSAIDSLQNVLHRKKILDF